MVLFLIGSNRHTGDLAPLFSAIFPGNLFSMQKITYQWNHGASQRAEGIILASGNLEKCYDAYFDDLVQLVRAEVVDSYPEYAAFIRTFRIRFMAHYGDRSSTRVVPLPLAFRASYSPPVGAGVGMDALNLLACSAASILSGEPVSSSVFECSNGMVELSDVGTSPVETFSSAVLCTVTGGDDGAESSAAVPTSPALDRLPEECQSADPLARGESSGRVEALFERNWSQPFHNVQYFQVCLMQVLGRATKCGAGSIPSMTVHTFAARSNGEPALELLSGDPDRCEKFVDYVAQGLIVPGAFGKYISTCVENLFLVALGDPDWLTLMVGYHFWALRKTMEKSTPDVSESKGRRIKYLNTGKLTVQATCSWD
jgi:hypothetical protein